ncbi:hypothetical protein [Arthrobacter sp. Soil763]|uniref:hypothetical protein n=1 Tax=Arthrobacter sp. Soil763 TaxID=1736402 RepID=UPI000A436340|nr:hypothetical protein [Arthrobacter sp. Soil763]
MSEDQHRRNRRHGRPSRRRASTLAGSVAAVAFVLLAAAAPAGADAGGGLGVDDGELSRHGSRVQVYVTYECPVGQTAGVGIFLAQAEHHGRAPFGGAGSGPLTCTGEPAEVVLTVPAGSGRFIRGCATATVSLFTREAGRPDNIEQITEEIRLEHSWS